MAHDPFSDKAAESFLEGAATAAKWPRQGHVVEGTVLSYRMDHQKDYETSEPLYWEGKRRVIESLATDKSRPVTQMVMEIQGVPTGETWKGLDNERVVIQDDDGVRALYVKAGLHAALKDAMRNSRAKLETGAYVRIERIANGPKTDPKKAAPHRYSATWTPARENLKAAQSFMDDEADEAPF